MAAVCRPSHQAPSWEQGRPALPGTPPQKPPLPSTYSESRFINTKRYGVSQRHPLAYDTHGSPDWTSEDEAEFTCLGATIERDNTEGLWHIVTASREVQRPGLQDQLGVETNNSCSKADFLHSSYSCSNTISSVASSCLSHERWLSGRVVHDPTLFTRGSRIDEPIIHSPSPHPLAQPGFYSPRIPPRSMRGLAAFPSNDCRTDASPVSRIKGFCTHSLPLPRSKMAILKPSRLCCTPQGFKTSVVEKPRLMRATITQTIPDPSLPSKLQSSLFQPIQGCTSQHQDSQHHSNQTQHQSSLGPVCHVQLIPGNPNQHHPNEHQSSQGKPIQGHCNQCQNQHQSQLSQGHNSQVEPSCSPKSSGNKNKYSVLQDREDPNTGDNSNHSNSNKTMCQVDMNSKNVFGEPRMLASLREVSSPRLIRKSTIEEDLKKLIVMDDTVENPQGDTSSPQHSDESQCSLLDSSSPSSPLSHSPALARQPLSTTRRPTHLSLQPRPILEYPSELVDRELPLDPGLIPLPDTAFGLEWKSLVNAATAYDEQKTLVLLSLSESQSRDPGMRPVPSPVTHCAHHMPRGTPTFNRDQGSEHSDDLSGQLYHLEATLWQLNSDLQKERKDKLALLAEVDSLRRNNQHLQKESLSANAQLHKFSLMFSVGPGEME